MTQGLIVGGVQVQVRQGLMWLWPTSGPMAWIESAASPAPCFPEVGAQSVWWLSTDIQGHAGSLWCKKRLCCRNLLAKGHAQWHNHRLAALIHVCNSLSWRPSGSVVVGSCVLTPASHQHTGGIPSLPSCLCNACCRLQATLCENACQSSKILCWGWAGHSRGLGGRQRRVVPASGALRVACHGRKCARPLTRPVSA